MTWHKPLSLSCINKRPGFSLIQSWIMGTIRSVYVSLLIVPQSFSQNTQGPFLEPEKQPQYIQPPLPGSRGIMHIRSNSWCGRLVTQIFLWRVSLTQVSSLHSIDSHCSFVQLRCSCAQASLRSLFFSEIGGFRRAQRACVKCWYWLLGRSYWTAWSSGMGASNLVDVHRRLDC